MGSLLMRCRWRVASAGPRGRLSPIDLLSGVVPARALASSLSTAPKANVRLLCFCFAPGRGMRGPGGRAPQIGHQGPGAVRCLARSGRLATRVPRTATDRARKSRSS